MGAYRDNNGKPYVFPIVRKVESEVVKDLTLDKEYAPIDGIPEFCHGAKQVLFGWDSPEVTSGRVVTAQSLSGTGALKMLADFLFKFRIAPMYMSKPTWANHHQLFKAAGLELRDYTYFDPATKGLDIKGFLLDL